jgi:thiol-disulfide isomerase/thioredoxin
MKYWIRILYTALLIGCNYNQPDIVTGFEGKKMPSFSLLLMDGITRINTNNIPLGNPIVIIFFKPTCPYCREETRDIVQHIQSFKNIQFYFLSNTSLQPIKQFSEEFKLKKYPNVIVAQDDQFFFANYYKISQVPCTAIYTPDKSLKQVFIGGISMVKIKKNAM